MCALVLVSLLVACGPEPRRFDDAGGSPPDPDPSTLGRASGRVWAPNYAPGLAPPGAEIPVYGASVWLAVERPPPLPAGAYCDKCVELPVGGTISSHDGSFEVGEIEGTYWLIIQKGQFRVDQQVTLVRGQRLALDATATTLPSVHDPDGGRFIPRVAVAIATNDNIQDVLGKIGLGEMTGNELTSGGTEIDAYENHGNGTPGPTVPVVGSVNELLGDLQRMLQYHIIFFPCSTQRPVLSPEVLVNIRGYIAAGGKLYVTDWSGEIVDRAFPQHITLGDPMADSTGTYDIQTLGGSLTFAGDADGDSWDTSDARVVDSNMSQWLGLQTGPTHDSAVPVPYEPNQFRVVDNWNYIIDTTPVMRGTDPETGEPIYDEPKTWVVGTGGGGGGGDPILRPMTVTYEPVGCGRVMYSTYQTADPYFGVHHAGLFEQERILLYLIMEIGVCSDLVIL